MHGMCADTRMHGMWKCLKCYLAAQSYVVLGVPNGPGASCGQLASRRCARARRSMRHTSILSKPSSISSVLSLPRTHSHMRRRYSRSKPMFCHINVYTVHGATGTVDSVSNTLMPNFTRTDSRNFLGQDGRNRQGGGSGWGGGGGGVYCLNSGRMNNRGCEGRSRLACHECGNATNSVLSNLG